MDYLDYSQMPDYVRRHFRSLTDSESDDTSALTQHGYYDIHRFFGAAGVDVRSVTVQHQPGSFQLNDPIIAQFAEEIAAEMEDRGLLKPGPPVMKLVSADWVAGLLKVCPVGFALVAGTCLALDRKHYLFAGKGGTLREYYKTRYPSTVIEDNPLAISLGVCGLLLVEEEDGPRFLKVRRSGRLITMAGTIGPSVAGNADYNPQVQTVAEIVETQMRVETCEELSLTEEEYSIVPLAYAREIFRGERPQLFSLIRCRIQSNELNDRLAQLCGSGGEFDQYEFASVKAAPSDLNHEAAMNFCLMREYLRKEAS